MHYIIMRHGQTTYNKQHLLQGRKDIPLSEDGLAQAHRIREEVAEQGIRFDAVYSSPLQRASVTAEIISGFPKEKIRLDPRVIEIDFGPLEGKKVESLDDNMRNFFNDPVRYVPLEGAESYDSMTDRIRAFWEEQKENKEEGYTLILSHGAAIHAMYSMFLGLPLEQFWDKAIGNCGYFEVSNETGDFEIVSEHMHAEAWTLPAGSFLNPESEQENG